MKGFTVGKEDERIRREIGVVFQDSLLDPLLTVNENLKARGALYGMSKKELEEAIQRVATLTRLQSFLDRPYGKLSGGERRRTDIARALLHTPSILILDEPTTGLDAESRKSLWNTVLQLQRETKMTVFLTTHYIEEAANSDYVVVMDKGKIIVKGTPEQLKNDYSTDSLFITPIDPVNFKEILKQTSIQFIEDKTLFIIPLNDTLCAIPLLIKYKEYIASFEVKKSSLDDVFLEITKEKGE
ncbi:ABC transporter ATP-binding protein [Sporosarcina pasteurii]|uniref:Daunorubicin/doxorubicin resistance ATP-binding protein DrrA n=1 Tax=Sporosarcina pasteurii TaxID=1474 RepID=A0A380BUJ9_SPOPA|nr:ABC transporter ATP-binding protein [Sporosarcina pasteurii]MDS9471250.1 ABC transporter ATP-binding protein [Sporosarcina pasteurii]SUJ06368.1 Daunorubicin/doxorubicin resistance ATP-binding protein DrrA [Sporosarcina pasteurii]